MSPTRTSTPALLLLAAAAPLAGCVAHVPRADEPMELMERSYLGYSTDRSISFEVAPALHLLVANGLDDPALFERGGRAAVFSVSLLATLRVSRGDSAPVRTPTYEPRARLQLFDVRPRGDPGAPVRPLRLLTLELALGHRSNGQRGCGLAEHVRRPGDGDFGCAPLTDPPSTRLNLEDGSFTTNYLAAGAGARWLTPGPARGAPARALTAWGALEAEVPCDLGACMSRPLRARHGPFVARGLVEAEWLVGRGVERRLPLAGAVRLDTGLRVSVSGTVHLGAERGPFGGLVAELAAVPRDPRGYLVGVFVRRHAGYDYLNIRFEQRFDAWVFGILFDPAHPEPLPAAGAPRP